VHRSVRIFSTPYELAEKFAEEMMDMIAKTGKRNLSVTIALAGGATPELLYSLVGNKFANSVRWEFVHFFWSDERCVPPDNPESNFGMAHKALFKKISIPSNNIHRIMGESDPAEEASRYSQEIERYTRKREGLPVFDLIILGLGDDGHTASIFPSDITLMESERICSVSTHPVTMQKRITLTGRIINNADKVTFIVTGSKKAEIVEKILNKNTSALNFPALLIVPQYGELVWFLDKDAASLL
jgi:6-phosphogluconolactonase